MITILISGPQGTGKTKIARSIIRALHGWGFTSFKVYTTNEAVTLPASANREDTAE